MIIGGLLADILGAILCAIGQTTFASTTTAALRALDTATDAAASGPVVAPDVAFQTVMATGDHLKAVAKGRCLTSLGWGLIAIGFALQILAQLFS